MQSVQMAIKSILGNKMRSFLTMLGIIIGVIAVVVLVSIGQGANRTVSGSIQKLGTNLLTVTITAKHNNPLTLSRLEELEQNSLIAYVSPVAMASGTLKAGLEQYEDGSIVATSPGYDSIRNYTVRAGRFLTRPDLDNRGYVAVLGQDAATELFGTLNAVGQVFTYKGFSFTVVGVLDYIGSSFAGPGDNLIIIPFTVGERLFQRKGLNSVYLSANSPDQVYEAEKIVRSFMEKLTADKAGITYNIYNQASILDTLSTVTSALTLMLAGIAGISLLVGGIGIMNIMLVSVSERTREIGIRKAIGASRRNILSQFLVEALVVSLFGGFLGLGISMLALQFMGPLLELDLMVSPPIALLAVSFSLIIGVVFGLYPANKASKLLPVEALRYE